MNTNVNLLYLSRDNIADLGLGPNEVVAQIEHLCQARERSEVRNAPKTFVKLDDERLFMSTLATAEDPPYMAVKSLGLNAANAAEGLDIIGSLITLFDHRTAQPLAIMDGDWITGIRTAGLSALAAKRFARADSAVIAFVGCGTQARAHLEILAALYPLREVRALGRGQSNRDALCDMAVGLGLTAVPCDLPREAVEAADIVVSSVPKSAALKPFLDAGWLKPGVFASFVDQGHIWFAESLNRFDRIVIDDVEQEADMEYPMLPSGMADGDIRDIVCDRMPGRLNDQERIAFVFRALALADLALASLAYERARELGMGTVLER